MAPAEDLRNSLTLPAFCAPMFLCSNAALAIACCEAGIVGSLTANHYADLAELEANLREVHEALARFADENPGRKIGPLAVNIAPTKDSDDFRAHLQACKRYGTRIIVTSVGNPTQNAPIVRDLGMLHFHDVTNIRFAEKAAAAGVDGMVVIGAGGGGHAGTISHLAFIPKVRQIFAGTLVMAGAVSTGAAIRAAEVLGADLAYMGTRFIATREAHAADDYKQMIVDSAATDIVYTPLFTGVHGNYLKGSVTAAGLDPANLPTADKTTMNFGSGSSAKAKAWRDIWGAGQGVGNIGDVPPAGELIERMKAEYAEARARLLGA